MCECAETRVHACVKKISTCLAGSLDRGPSMDHPKFVFGSFALVAQEDVLMRPHYRGLRGERLEITAHVLEVEGQLFARDGIVPHL